MAVTLDLQDGHTASLSLTDGWTMERIAIVTGVTGSGHARIYNAALAAGMPLIGDLHPTLAYAHLDKIICDAVTTDYIKFRLIYTDSYTPPTEIEGSLDTIQVGGQVSQLESNKDKDDDLMTVTYTFPSDDQYGSWSGQSQSQAVQVPKLVAEHSIQITKTEYAHPGNKAEDYVGTVNDGDFDVGDQTIQADPRQWMCAGIQGVSRDGGQTYTVTYSFAYRKDTWDAEVVFKDPLTGRPPADADNESTQPDALKAYQLYATANFDNLSLAT